MDLVLEIDEKKKLSGRTFRRSLVIEQDIIENYFFFNFFMYISQFLL